MNPAALYIYIYIYVYTYIYIYIYIYIFLYSAGLLLAHVSLGGPGRAEAFVAPGELRIPGIKIIMQKEHMTPAGT